MTTVVRVTIDEQNPWPGLGSFDEAAERFFNGRRNESTELHRLVLNAPLTVLFGASGLGKTSLVQAGLFPLLRKAHYLPVYVRLDLRDRTAPLIDQVRFALQAQFEAQRIDAPAMRDDESLWGYLHRAGLELWSEQNQLLTPLFVFDQFEEVFTLGAENPAAVARLRIDLADLIENRLPAVLASNLANEGAGEALSLDSQRYKVLLSFREDFLPPVEGWKRELPSILRNRLRLLPLSREQAIEAVHTTAPKLVDKTLAEEIVDFVAAAQNNGKTSAEEIPKNSMVLAVEPALLSLVCHGLNEKRKAQGKEQFDKALLSGTGQSIISDYYAKSVDDLPERVQRFIEKELITERGFRKPCDIDDARSVHGVTDQELRLLVDRRLLRIEPQRGTEWVELTHDLLTRVVREHRDLWRERSRREQERARVRRLQRLALAFGSATAILLAAILVYCVAYVWPYKAYYRDYEKKWGVPQGIGPPLSTAEVGHRFASYQITKKGRKGPIVSMQLVDAAEQPRDLIGTIVGISSKDEIATKVSRWEYAYDEHYYDEQHNRDDRRLSSDQKPRVIAYEIFLDRNGHRLQSIIYSRPDTKWPSSRFAYKIGPNGSLREEGLCVAFERYDYSPEGYEKETRYLDQNGSLTPGKSGAFITRREYDRQGHVVRLISLWKDGRPMNDKAANAELLMSYDASGNQIASEARDAAHKPIDLKNVGYQRFTCKYDDLGNCEQVSAWHADGTPFLMGGLCQTKQFSYDNQGNIVKEVCLSTDGKQLGTERIKYDKDDRPIEETWFDRGGRPAIEPDYGAFRVATTYDANGNLSERALFDENGKPTLGLGSHSVISKFDVGHEIWTEFRGTNGKLIGMNAGYAAIERKYDQQGNEVQRSYLSIDNHPIANRNEGFAIKQSSFDGCGRETKSKFLDNNRLAIRSNKGYASIEKTYDENNNVINEIYLDEKERPIRSVDGYASVTRQFDRHRNITDEQYFDEKGKALLLKGAYAEHTSQYDDHNALVEEAFRGVSKELVPNEKGWARHTRRYDEHNALVEEAYFGAGGEPVVNEKGWARMTNVNDDHGRRIETSYWGTDGKPINIKEGYAKRTERYDPQGAVVEIAFFGATGKPVLIDQGFALVKNTNDQLGRMIEQAFFGVRGEPVIGTKDYPWHREKLVLDDRGKQLEFATFGIDERPINVKGYARRTDRYDPYGAVVEEAYFGISGEPALNDQGYARVTYVKDSHGKTTEAAYFGTDGKPLNQKHGYAKIAARYDDYGAEVEEAYFGASGQPVLSDNGVTRIRMANDEFGRVAEWAYFGVRGEPVIEMKKRYHRARQVLDERGNQLEFATFGIDGKPLEVANSPGGPRCARLVRRFNATNKEVSSECFSADGKLKSRKASSLVVRRRWPMG